MRAYIAAIIILAMAVVLAPLTAANAAGVLTFADQAEVTMSKVTLKDLVGNAQGLDAGFSKRLAKVKVTEAPRMGRTTTVRGSQVRTLLARAKPPRDLSVLIPAEVNIRRASQRVTTSDISLAFGKAFSERMAAKGGDYDLHSVNAGHDLVLPAGRLETKVNFLGRARRGMITAKMEFWVNGSLAAKRRVTGKVDRYAKVVVAKTGLSRKQVLEPEDVKLIRMRLNDIHGAVASSIDDVMGLRTRVPVAAGEILLLTRLERAPLIRRGDIVSMIYTSGRLKVTAKGRAEQTGYKDGNIKLINLASRREVYGKVLDSGTVLVKF